MRKSPAVKRELPPASSSGARSRTRTRFAVSFAESAAHRAALPPPTTMTSQSAVGIVLSGGANRGPGFSENLAQHERQDAAVLVVVHLDRRVDAQQHLDLLLRSVLAADDERRFLLRPDARFDAGNDDDLVPLDSERLHRIVAGELEREHAHADEVRAVDALEALHD